MCVNRAVENPLPCCYTLFRLTYHIRLEISQPSLLGQRVHSHQKSVQIPYP